MIQVLIISELFYPQNAIGALRPTKLRELLIQKGYRVDVITKSFSDRKDNDEHGYVWRINAARDDVKKSIMQGSGVNHKSRCIVELKRAKRTLLSIKNSKLHCDAVIRFVEKNNIDISGYHAIITTFGPTSSVMIGQELKKRFPTVNWICDFRDPMVVEEVSVILKPLMALLQSKACKEADHIIAVSNGYLKRICGSKYASKRHMIPNGYDLRDNMQLETCMLPADALHIAYVGALYEGKRKITPLFRALRELADAGKVDLNRVRFDYAGRDGAFLLAQAEEYGLGSIVCDHSVLSREECLKLQFSSHMLVLSTWNNRGEEGVFPGKFLEYMLIGRPIISLTDGNMPNGEVTQVMREGKFGVAYEAACDQRDRVPLKDYIEACYAEWQQKGSITFEPVQDVLDRYNYDHIIEQIEELIHEG